MKRIILLYFVLIGYVSFAQEPLRIDGSKLSFQLPSDFYIDNKISGFISKVDSSSIQTFELNIHQTFDVWINDQISKILSKGFDTTNTVRNYFNGYKSIQFLYAEPGSNSENYLILFGNDSLQNIIFAKYKKPRRTELLEAVHTAKYDSKIEYDYFQVIGFKPEIKNSNLKLASKSAISIRYEERNEKKVLVAYLNFVKFIKSTFAKASPKDVINYFAEKYYPNREYVKEVKLIIDGKEAISSVFKTKHEGYDEYSIVTVLFLDDFNILIMGDVNNLNKLDPLLEDIKLLKIN